MDFWKHITIDKHILDGFCQCGYIDFDGSIDKLNSKVPDDTIKNREVPYKLAEEVKVFIVKMKSIEDDDVQANGDEERY